MARQKPRVWSKKFVQQGRSHFEARSVLALREHGKMARTPLTTFFKRPLKEILQNGDDAQFNSVKFFRVEGSGQKKLRELAGRKLTNTLRKALNDDLLICGKRWRI